MKTIKSILYILLFFSANALAQNSVKGKVTNKVTGKQLEGINIFIPEYKKVTSSDSKGEFSFEGLGKGIVKIQATGLGYKSVVQTLVLNSNTDIIISMEVSETELEEVLITSNSSSLPDNIPFSANGVSQKDIRKYSSPSLMGNLSYQPGVDKISLGNGIGKPVIRGLSFNRIMLFSQGTRIENQQWDDHHDLGLSDIGLENVEIVRGPAALIYGADAMGGALIFVDEKPAAAGTNVGDVNLGFGSNTLGINGDFGFKGAAKNGLFYGARFGGASHTNYIQGEKDEAESENKSKEEEEFAANSKFMNMAGKANVGIIQKWGVSKLSYSYFNQQSGIVEVEPVDTSGNPLGEEEQRDREMEAPYQDVTTQIISLENTILTGKSKVNINVGYQTNDRKEFEPTDVKGEKELAIGLQLKTTTYDVKWTSNQEKSFGVTIGSQGTFLKNTNNGIEALVPDANVSDIAGYGLFRYDHNKLNLLGGVRFDARHIEAMTYRTEPTLTDSFIVVPTVNSADTVNPKPSTDFKKDYSPVSFSIGAAYHLNSKFTIKLNAATGFSAPNYAQLATYGKHEGTYRFERGDRNLKVEQNAEGDLGFIYENEFISLNIGGYYNKIKNYIYIANTGDSMVAITDAVNQFPLYDYKQGDATISGGEFGFDIHPAKLKWLDLKVTYAVINGKLDKGGNLPYIPSNKLIGEVKLSKDKFWKFNDNYISFVVRNFEKQKNVAEYELATDGYTLLDIHIGASFKLGKQKATFDIFCTNAINTGYYNQLSLVKYIGVRDMGRNIGLQLHIPFGK